MTDKRPQDWTPKERFNLIVECASMNDDTLNGHCRSHALYPHHIRQWRLDFINGHSASQKPSHLQRSKH